MNTSQEKELKIYLALLPLIVFFISWIMLFAGDREPLDSPKIINGHLDMSAWHPDSRQMINLSGKWEFYWQKLYSYRDLRNGVRKPDISAKVPAVWNTYQINGKHLPGFGFATYRIKIKNLVAGKRIAIRMSTVSAAYRLYANAKLLAFNGEVGRDNRHCKPQYRPVTVEFMPPSQDFDLIIQAANFSYARGGVWDPIYMGSVKSIADYDRTNVYKDLFLLGAFLIMALYYFSFFFMRREDKSSLYFVFLCLNAIGRTAIFGDYSIGRIIPGVGYDGIVRIDYLTLYWFPVAFALLIGELFPGHVSRKLQRIFVVYASGMSLFSLLAPIYTFTSLMYLFQAVVLIIFFYTVICSARAFSEVPRDSTIVMAGALAVALGGVHDVLYQDNIISSHFGELSSFGFLVFLFLQSFILAKRLAEAFHDAEMMSEKLMKLDQLKDEFFANTSHELKTPLNAMINIADGLSRGAEGSVNEAQKECLTMITTSGRHLVNLVNNIIDYTKLKNSDLKMNFQPIGLKRIVETVMHELERFNKIEGVQMLMDIPDDLPNILADENRMLQILYNLVGHALKFMKTGVIKVSAKKVGNTIEISVTDTGNSVPEEQLNIIFQPFWPMDESLTLRNGGAGLWLSITKYLVEAHGGQILVESQTGVGSKFYFSVPVWNETAKEKPQSAKAVSAEAAVAKLNEQVIKKFPYRHKAGGAHIMLVDDNEANLISLTGILAMENYSVTAVTSSEAFFEEFKTVDDVCLIILDVMLPGLSGYEICHAIRRNFLVSELPILILTARISTADIVAGMKAGANDYLAKPFDAEELLARVNTLIQLKTTVDKAMTAEMAFLQAQIRPHFLFNALNTIISILRVDTDKARNLLINFSDYLRRSFEFKDLSQFVPLKNELDLTRAYVEIEKARFEERLEVNFTFAGNLEVQVPALMIQPLLENAIIHGILPKPDGGRVDVEIKREGQSVLVNIKDNGVGMDLAKLQEVLTCNCKNGVGLGNIQRRLKKLSGKGLEIKSKPGEGTEVILNIPISSREGMLQYD